MKPDYARVLRFIVIGGVSTALYFTLLYLLRPVIASTALLAAACYALSMVFNFVAQGLWTFKSQGLTGATLGRYVVVQGGALITNSAGMTALVDYAQLNLYLSQIIVTTVVTGGVFHLMKNWVYR